MVMATESSRNWGKGNWKNRQMPEKQKGEIDEKSIKKLY